MPDTSNRYLPIEGGWKIRIASGVPNGQTPVDIGVCPDNPRLHRRPLYPPADRGIFLEKLSPEKFERLPLRPLVIAYNTPRFIFDFHHAGGLLGHLLIGLAPKNGGGLWLHEWAELETRYVNGRMEYELSDSRFPGIHVSLVVVPLAGAAGAVVHWNISGSDDSTSLVFCYGGASAYFTNHNFTHQAFTFHPDQCALDKIRCSRDGFALTRKFDQTKESENPGLYPAAWEAEIQGCCAPRADRGWGDPEQAMVSPAALLDATVWFRGEKTATRTNRVAVQRLRLRKNTRDGYFVAGMGPGMAKAAAEPDRAYEAALARTEAIARRVRIQTPDAYLNAAAVMTAFCLEGIWGDLAYVHGGWSWRCAYLGWRIWYGPDAYGWTDRVKTSIQNHLSLSLLREGDDQGGLRSLIEHKDPFVYYNMNEVFLDHVRHYFDYTNDLDFMREIYPALQGIIEWETRRLKPAAEPLYENALNTWISDSHWCIRGQCTQASSYMLNAHRFMARLAECLGRDPEPWRKETGRIREAMQRKLWQRRTGVFAEALDTLGHKQIHPEPELPTIYHAAEFGAADPLQIYQMLYWADTHLTAVSTPYGGKQLWSSNWHPQKDRSYTHSTYEMAYAENLNYALTNYLGGRGDEAWRLIRATLDGLFNGPTPGGLSCHAHVDGRQRKNDEFADATSMWARTLLEGLFGIVPKRPEGTVDLCPQFPSGWPEASVETPHFSYRWNRDGGRERVEWRSPELTRVRLRLPARAAEIEKVLINGKPAGFEAVAGVGLTWIMVETPAATTGTIEINYVPAALGPPVEMHVRPGETIKLDISRYGAKEALDPQGILESIALKDGILQGLVKDAAGPAVMFIRCDPKNTPFLLPLPLRIEPAAPGRQRRWTSPGFKDRHLAQWRLIDLRPFYNAPVTEVVARAAGSSRPPELPASRVNFEYWKEHLINRLPRGRAGLNLPVSDAAWRAKTDKNGVAWTAENIPFQTAKTGDNIAVVTLAGGFPKQIEIPVRIAGRMLYLMISGVTWPAQSHVVNLRLTLWYQDGSMEKHDLANPADIGDCWDTWLGWCHDTAANGFENIGGRFGPAGSNETPNLDQPVAVDTEAHLLAFPLRLEQSLESIKLEAVANDVIFGLLGATVLTGANSGKKSS